MNDENTRTKRIFISDIHLNDQRSYEVQPSYNYPYFWISTEHIDLLENFLKTQVLESRDVKELIILGDLFDQWVIPTKPSAYVNFDAVYNNPQNAGVISALHAIINQDQVAVYYAPGNHDMLMDEKAVTGYFPGIRYCGSDREYVGTYLNDGIGAEHCSQYSFFCAPNPVPKNNRYLPTGYFLSRYGAEQEALKKESPNFLEILKEFIKNHFKKGDAGFIKDMMLSVGNSVGLSKDSTILLDRIDQFPQEMTVQKVAEFYSDAMTLWNQVKPNGLDAFAAIMTEALGYSGCAFSQYYNRKKARVIVFGHTHDAMLQGYSVDGDGNPHEDDKNGCDYIYANSGTWIDKHPCSFIETEIKGNSHYVTWFEYTGDGRRKSIKERHIFL